MPPRAVIAVLCFIVLFAYPAFSMLAPQQKAEYPFSNESLQPGIPSLALNSSYSLLQELSSWSNLSVFTILITQFPDIFDHLWSTTNTIFAPSDDAIRIIFNIFTTPVPPDTAPSLIASRTMKLFSILALYDGTLPTLADLIMYHIVPQNLSEHQLVEKSRVQPLFGPSLDVSNYPTEIRDADPFQNTSRLSRQMATSTGRVSIISSILVPLNVTESLIQGGLHIPEIPPPSTSLFTPLESLHKLVSARNDLIVLKTLLSHSESLRALLTSSDHKLYLFAPNDYAFVQLVKILLPDDYIGYVLGDVEAALVNVSRIAVTLQSGGEISEGEALGNPVEIENFSSRLAVAWESVDVLPTLEQVVLHHMLNTSLSHDELIAAGPQPTLLSDEKFPGAALTVTEQGVIDASERKPAGLISSFATRTGFATVLDSVLLPFTVAIGEQIIAAEITPLPDGVESLQPGAQEEGPTTEPDDQQTPGLSIPSASPPAEPLPEARSARCFPSSSSVRLFNGTDIRMNELEAGFHVHVGDGSISKVFLFTHKQPNVTATFVRIFTTSGHHVSLTPGHYLYANRRLTAAGFVTVGDILETTDGRATVVKTEKLQLRGLYAPHTIHGDIIVDGIRVSGYSTAVHPAMAQALLAPLRYLAERGWSEPLGHILYNGADKLATALPRGSLVH